MIIFLFALFQNALCTLEAEKAFFVEHQAIFEKNIEFTLTPSTKLTCEYAYIDKKKEKVTLQKEVLFSDLTRNLLAKCDMAELIFEDKKLATLTLSGNVEIQKNDHLLIYASSIVIYPEKDHMLVEGSKEIPVQMFDLNSLSHLTAEEIEISSFLKSGQEKIVAKKGIHGIVSEKKLEILKEKWKHGAFTSKKDF